MVKYVDLSKRQQQCVDHAINYLQFSYAPYSRFKVAAAILDKEGRCYGGANQENASYPLCLCAERVALHHYAMVQPNIAIQSLAVTVKHESIEMTAPAMPCGACRQVIAEYQHRNNSPIELLMVQDKDRIMVVSSVDDLLPFGFKGDFLIS